MEAGQGQAETQGCTGPGLTCFLRVIYTLPGCLHGQEVEEDPQGAGKAPEMGLTPLAAYPVHLLGDHNALRDTDVERECTRGEEKRMEMEREASRRLEGLLTALRQMSSLAQATNSRVALPSSGHTHPRSIRAEKL